MNGTEQVPGRRYAGRREDDRLLAGRGCYTADRDLPGQAHAAFLRADRAHAKIVAVDLARARAASGVLAAYSGEDALRAAYASQPAGFKLPGIDGKPIKVPVRHALATDRVRFVGECVAMVVAESGVAAADALELIDVEYQDLPPLIDPEDAFAPGAPRIHEEIEGNRCFEFEFGDAAQVESAFASAALVAKVEVLSQRLIANPLEPRACLASWDRASETFDLYSPNQGLSVLRDRLAGFVRVPVEKIRLHTVDVGGGFGNRSGPYPEHVMVMHAARELGRPVKWVGSRSEGMLSDHQGRGLKLGGELALDAGGNFLAIRIAVTGDMGAYHTDTGPMIATIMPRATATGAYRIPHAYGFHQLALTNCPPVTAYRGAGRPDIAYMVERLVDEAARASGIDRIELRRRNLIPREAFPYKTPTNEYDSGDYHALLDEALKRSEWDGFAARRAASAARGRLRGIGLSVFVEPSGGGPHPAEQSVLKFTPQGIVLHTLSGSSGQGHETVFPEIVADALGIPPERIALRASDPYGPKLVGHGTIGSRSTMSHGSSLLQGAREVIRKGLELAATELEAAAVDIEYAQGEYRVKGTDRRIGLFELARRHAGGTPTSPSNPHNPLDTIGEIAPRQSFPSGAHVAEVEIDPETGAIDWQRYVAVDDCGRVINHVLVEGQVHGGIAQGLGQVLGEHAFYDRASGQLLAGSFMDYYMPRADDFPWLDVFDCSVLAPGNLLGVKGVGEAGTSGALSAVSNAVLDGLRERGVTHLDLPLTPTRVWQALRRKAPVRD